MPSKTQKNCLIFLVFVVISYFVLVENNGRNFCNSNTNNSNCAKNRTLRILYWTPMFREKDFNLGLGQKIFENCAYKNCLTTDDRKSLPIEDFDAVLFHGVEYFERIFGRPEKRNPKQIYVVSIQESPDNTPSIILTEHRNFFNWTMTYRLDSDIIRPYGIFYPSDEINYSRPSVEEIKKRPKLMAWMVSNCVTNSHREEMYRKLTEFLPIDVYGSCGNLTCLKSDAEECYQMIEDNYKFYLSFENSYCVDYVTEKLYNVLKKNVIPVVLGGADYGKIAPPKSVINVVDYSSVEKLVNHLKYLDNNPQEYLEYFAWKQHFVVDTSSQSVLCKLCEKLNQPSIEPKVYPDIYKWWNGQNDNQCLHASNNENSL